MERKDQINKRLTAKVSNIQRPPNQANENENINDSLFSYLEDIENYCSTFDATKPSNYSLKQCPQKATILSSVINLCNSLVGSGILGLAYAVKEIGWLSSIILLSVCAVICAFTFQLQTSAAIIYNNSTQSLSASYYNLSSVTVPQLQLISDLTIALATFGACCSYLIIIGDLMPQIIIFIFPDMSDKFANVFLQRRLWIGCFLITIILPMTIKKKLNALRYTSFIAILCFLYIIIMMLIFLNNADVNICNAGDRCGIIPYSKTLSAENIFAFFKAVPFYIGAFAAHSLSFSVSNELSNSTFSRMNYVNTATFVFTSMLYLSAALIGYFTFGNNVNSNILTNYPQNDVLTVLARVGLLTAVACSYPVITNPGRHCLSSILYKKNASQISKTKFYIVSSIWMSASLIVTMIVDDLGVMLRFMGSTASPMGTLILPGLYYYYSTSSDSYKGNYCVAINRYGSIITVTIGIVLIPFCLVVMFVNV